MTISTAVGWSGRSMFKLWHYEIGEEDDFLYASYARAIGIFSSQERADEAAALLRAKPGFRAWPGGFRCWNGGVDLVYGWGGGYGREIETFDAWPDAAPVLPLKPGQPVYDVTSFNKPEAEIGDVHRDEDGPRMIGTFTAHDLAEAAIRIVREDPEFRTRQDGFRITEFVIDEPAFPEGY